MTAEEVLLLGKDDLEKVFDEVNSHLENCIEKLLVIRVQVLSEQEGNGSECNHSKLGTNNYLAAKDGDGDKEENEEEREEENGKEREGVVRGKERRKRVGGEGNDVDSNHAIQGNSSMRSSPFPSSATTHSSRHCNDEEEERTEVEQKNHGDHYYLEGLKQKGGGRRDDSLSTTETAANSSYNSQLPPSLFAGDPNREEFSQSRRQGIKSSSKDSTSSFEEHKYVIRSSEFEESDENPSSYVVDVKKPGLTTGKPPIGSRRMSENEPEEGKSKENSSDGNESNPDTILDQKDIVPTFMMKSYSNEEIVFRMADERAHQQLGHVPQEHNWTDYSARLSLPSLDPPTGFRDHVSTHELAPTSMHRTPELVNITRNKATDGDDGQVCSTENHPRILKEDSSETKTTTTSSCDRFDTASSEIYFSQDGNSPPDQSLSDSPPLFVATANKPPLASPPTSSSYPSYRKRNSYPKINIPIGINLSIRISHVNDPSDFWIHINRDQVNMLFNEIQLLQEKFVQSNHVSVRAPVVGSIYATRYSSDVSWYRVQVTDLLLNNYVNILFIDYGFTTKVNYIDLSILSPLLEDKPAQAFNCFLKGVQAPSGSWTPKAVEEFKNSVSFYSVRAIFYDAIQSMANQPSGTRPLADQPSGTQRTKYPVDLFLDWGSGEMNNVLLYLSPTEFVTNELNM